VLDALGADVRSRLANVRDGLRELAVAPVGRPGVVERHARARRRTQRPASRSKVVTRERRGKVSTVAARRSPAEEGCAVQVTCSLQRRESRVGVAQPGCESSNRECSSSATSVNLETHESAAILSATIPQSFGKFGG